MRRKANPKKQSQIESEWDALCSARQDAIDSGKDFSLSAVTAPCIIRELCGQVIPSILDVGCGTGYLTSQLAKHAEKCVGIDISAKSISIAKSRYSESGAKFVRSSIGDYHSVDCFNICVANMVFSSDPDWIQSIQAIFKLLDKNGCLLVMLPHPCFWAKYWGIDTSSWFFYNEEVYIEHDFSLSLAKSLGTATYIHRPLSQYINTICSGGFILEKIEEPYPTKDIPPDYVFDYPRFLFLKFRKIYTEHKA